MKTLQSSENCQQELPAHAATPKGETVGTSSSNGCADWSVVLPWPSSILSPNARPHWRKLATERKALRNACKVLSINAGAPLIAPELQRAVGEHQRIPVHCDFFPPNRRRHDDANLMHRMKAAIDGVADALGIDDRHFKTSYDLNPEIGGYVRLTISHNQPKG